MDSATQILVLGGMTLLAFGLLMGIPMILARSKAPQPPRYLLAAHLAAIIQGGLLLALTIALEAAALSSGWAMATAAFLVGGMMFFTFGLTINWLQGVKDAFGENAIGGKVSAVGTPFVLGGAGILYVGVLVAL